MAPYSFRLAFQSLVGEKWINLLSVFTIASGLLVISVAFFAAYNIDAATRKLPEKFAMILYLDDAITRDKIEGILGTLKKKPVISQVLYIPKDDAMKELKSLLKNANYVFEGLDENPLPDSIEVRLRREAVTPDGVRKLTAEITGLKGVKEIDYGEKFLAALHSLKSGVRTVGLSIIVAIAIGIIFVCYSTVKILFYRRTEEIETFKLLGATKFFIRAPFIIEGGVIGMCGGLASLGGSLILNYAVIARLSTAVPLLATLLFPLNLFLLLPLIGLFLGVTGAMIAIGRLRY
ncbi:MAG: permease-like cell division protein FtsX [Thermodesulfovibrionales bacterium]